MRQIGIDALLGTHSLSGLDERPLRLFGEFRLHEISLADLPARQGILAAMRESGRFNGVIRRYAAICSSRREAV